MTYTGEMVLPRNAVVMQEEEMRYVDGGISIPNWLVSGFVNTALTFLIGGISGSLASAARKAFKQKGKTFCSKQLKKKLMAIGLSAGFASGICGAIIAVIDLSGCIGDRVASYWDKHDSHKNNGYCSF